MSLLHRTIARSVTRPALLHTTRPASTKPFNQPNADQKLEADRQKEEQGSSGTTDAINASKGQSAPEAAKLRQQSSTPESGGFQPGQMGEQIGGQEGGKNQSVGETTEAAAPSLFQTVKTAVGLGNADHRQSKTERREFSTSVRAWTASGGDKTAGAQNEHIVHHEAGEEDKMPAVKNNAELPSKKDEGVEPSDKPKPSNSKAAPHPAAGSAQPGYGSGPGTAGMDSGRKKFSTSAFHLAEPTTQGLHDSLPAAYNVPPHLSSVTATAANASPRAVRRYVRGTPEPSSYKLGYHIVDYQTPEAYKAPMPSSAVPRSSVSTEAANPNTTHTDPPTSFRSIPPDFDTEVRGKWSNPVEGEKEVPPEGDKITGATAHLREGGPRHGERTMDKGKEQAPTAGHSDSATVALEQEAKLKGSDPESTKASVKTHKVAKPAFPDDVAPKGEAPTTLEEAKKTTKKARSGPIASKK